MREESSSMWEGKENWFKYEKNSGLRDFPEAKSLGFTATKVALRSLKYHLEDEMGVEITDELFMDVFRKVCNFNPKPAFGGLAGLEFVEPLKRILVRHGYESRHVNDIWRVFRVNLPSQRYYKKILLHVPHSSSAFPEESKYTWNDLDDEERLLIDYYTDELFDSIVCNPPFFVHSLLSPDEQRTTARHAGSLTYADLFQGVVRLLHEDGVFSAVIPTECRDAFDAEAILHGLCPVAECAVKTSLRKRPKRFLLSYRKKPSAHYVRDVLTIGSEAYVDLMKDFYLSY